MGAGSKEHIVETAFKLFLRMGYAETTMMDLVRESELSKGAFYHYFQTKESLLRAAVEHLFLRFLPDEDEQRIDSDLRQYIQVLWSGLSNLLYGLVDMGVDLMSYYRFLFSAFEIFPDIKSEVSQLTNNRRQALTMLLHNEQQLGNITSKISAEQLADQLLSLIEGRGLLLSLEESLDKAKIERSFSTTVNDFFELISNNTIYSK